MKDVNRAGVEDDDEPLPPLEEVDEKQRISEGLNSNGNRSTNPNLVKYDGNGSSEDEDNSGRVTYYTNLDELD